MAKKTRDSIEVTQLGLFEEALVKSHYYMEHVKQGNYTIMGLVDNKSVPVGNAKREGGIVKITADSIDKRFIDFLNSYEPSKR